MPSLLPFISTLTSLPWLPQRDQNSNSLILQLRKASIKDYNRVAALCLLSSCPGYCCLYAPSYPHLNQSFQHLHQHKNSSLKSTKQKRERPSDRANQIISRPPLNQVSSAPELFYVKAIEKLLSDCVMLYPSFLSASLPNIQATKEVVDGHIPQHGFPESESTSTSRSSF